MNIKNTNQELRAQGYVEGELTINPFWYIIWEPENIDQYNLEYEVQTYAPGFTAFGENGGGELLVINDSGQIFTLPTIGMEPQYAEKISDNIDTLKKYMKKDI
jgi:hypothetical protein